MKKKNQKDEMIPGVGQNNKTSTEKPGTDINANNNSKDPATATDELRITARANSPRNAEEAAHNVEDVVNGGGSPIAEMDKQEQIASLGTLARAIKESSITKEVFLASVKGVPYKRVKAALKSAGVPAGIRDEILGSLPKK